MKKLKQDNPYNCLVYALGMALDVEPDTLYRYLTHTGLGDKRKGFVPEEFYTAVVENGRLPILAHVSSFDGKNESFLNVAALTMFGYTRAILTVLKTDITLHHALAWDGETKTLVDPAKGEEVDFNDYTIIEALMLPTHKEITKWVPQHGLNCQTQYALESFDTETKFILRNL